MTHFVSSDVPGYLYVLHHDSFTHYGTDVYKLGLTINPKQRIKNYITGFIEAPKYAYVSSQFYNCKKAEKVLFYLLQAQRMKDNREFFQVPLDRSIAVIKQLEQLQPKELNRLYSQICWNIVPREVRKALLQGVDAVNVEAVSIKVDQAVSAWDDEAYDKQLQSVFDLLDTFRFCPKDPTLYYKYGYVDPEKEAYFKLRREVAQRFEGTDYD